MSTIKYIVAISLGISVPSLFAIGVAALMALSKLRIYFGGLTWDNGDETGGMCLQGEKNNYRGVTAGLEGVVGRKVVNSDALAMKI